MTAAYLEPSNWCYDSIVLYYYYQVGQIEESIETLTAALTEVKNISLTEIFLLKYFY